MHDESCWKMGGVGPHAGLFGSIEDVAQWLADFSCVLGRRSWLSPRVSHEFLSPRSGDWRLGSNEAFFS